MHQKITTKGFSLIELAIAITIMGILSVAAYQGFQYAIEKAHRSATKSVLRTFQSSIKQFHNDTGTYPRAFEDLLHKPTDPKVAKSWEGPYTDKAEIPDDGWKHPFVYKLNAKGAQPPYELYSWGPHDEGSPQEEWISVWRDLE